MPHLDHQRIEVNNRIGGIEAAVHLRGLSIRDLGKAGLDVWREVYAGPMEALVGGFGWGKDLSGLTVKVSGGY